MKTNFISPDGVNILKLQKNIECPYSENPETFSWCPSVGLFSNPKTLPPRSTGRIGGFFGVANGRQYSFPVVFSISTLTEAKMKCSFSCEYPIAIPKKFGGGFVIGRPGLPTSIKNMISNKKT